MTITFIEADLAPDTDPVAAALRRLGHTSISTGLRTAQVDGQLYDLSPEAQAIIARWLDGERPIAGTIRLERHQIIAQRV